MGREGAVTPVFACVAHAPDLGAVAAAGRGVRGAELGLLTVGAVETGVGIQNVKGGGGQGTGEWPAPPVRTAGERATDERVGEWGNINLEFRFKHMFFFVL